MTARGGCDGCGVAAYNSSNRPVPVSLGPGAVVFANRMEGSRADWRGIVFLDGEEGRMYGWLAVPTDSFTIPLGQVLHVGPRQTLTLARPVIMTSRGQLAVSPGGVLLPSGAISSPVHQSPGADAPGQPA